MPKVGISSAREGHKTSRTRMLDYQGKLWASLVSRPSVVQLYMRPQPSRVDACEVRLVEINSPLDLSVACLAERSQVPGQEVPLVTIQVVNRKDKRAGPVLDSAEFTTPARSPSHPS